MKVLIKDNYQALSQEAARVIKERILKNPWLVLGLATGSTPLGLYRELVKMHQRGEIDFSRLTAFNLDEYLGLSADSQQSYHFFMEQNLFSKINIKKNNIFIPDGRASNPIEHCNWYEAQIKEKGGIDLQVLGIGRNGHLGFNEPGSNFDSRTRVVDLADTTIKDNSRFFDSREQVPTKAITMGLATIMKAKEIILLASGENKAEAIKKALKGPVTEQVPASVLQRHPQVIVILDHPAASLL